MAARLIPVRVGDIELLAEATPVAGSENTSKAGYAAERTLDAFDRAQDAILGVAKSTVETIHKAGQQAVQPDQLQVAFGLSFSAQGNILIAGASGQANLTVTLTYNRPAS